MGDDTVSYPNYGNASCLQIEDESFWFRHRNECISILVSKFAFKGHFVDVGGGNGFVARRLMDDGHDVTLIEPGTIGASNALEHRNIRRVICATLSSSMESIGLVDAVGAFDVVEHIHDDEDFIRQLAQVLKPGGFFFSTVPAHEWLWSSADDEAGHFNRYTSKTYTALLAPYFDVRFISYFFAPLIIPIYILRAIPYRMGIGMRPASQSLKREHGTANGLSSRMLTSLLRPELERIASLKPSSFGSSLIVAAQKR